ncbi:hypothetical protein TELCIR_25084, partial [Teladorsagia circumcincta]
PGVTLPPIVPTSPPGDCDDLRVDCLVLVSQRTGLTITFAATMKAQNLAKLLYFKEFQYDVFKRSGEDSRTAGLPESENTQE